MYVCIHTYSPIAAPSMLIILIMISVDEGLESSIANFSDP